MWRQNKNIYNMCIYAYKKMCMFLLATPQRTVGYLQNCCGCLSTSAEGHAVTSVNCIRWECQYTQLTNYWPLVLSYFRQPVRLYRVTHKHMAPRLRYSAMRRPWQSTEFQQVIMGLEGSNSGCQGLGYLSHMSMAETSYEECSKTYCCCCHHK